jgi:hypothetical protein
MATGWYRLIEHSTIIIETKNQRTSSICLVLWFVNAFQSAFGLRKHWIDVFFHSESAFANAPETHYQIHNSKLRLKGNQQQNIYMERMIKMMFQVKIIPLLRKASAFLSIYPIGFDFNESALMIYPIGNCS